MRILDFIKFKVSEKDFPDLLARLSARLCSTTVHWLHFQALHYMKPQRKRRDGVGPGKLGDISSSFHAHREAGRMLDGASSF